MNATVEGHWEGASSCRGNSALPDSLRPASNCCVRRFPNRQPPAERVNAFCEIRFSPIHGRGIFTRRPVRKGVHLLEYRGELVDKEESNRRGLELFDQAKVSGGASVYIFDLNDTHDLDGNKPWNAARLVNHSCEPNSEMVNEDDRLMLYSLRDLRKGEEITFDYGYGIEHFLDHPCRCGTTACVGYIVARAYWPRLKKTLARTRAGKGASQM